ncbi:metal ABC transporter permease [Synechococcus sp. PCC 7336]|uniref:metal ABC transporter permease n=1 Tax=Synechococcus sp. PCC 7336 TaxID=195250 RepID=UPI0003487581|nr:metal ABC transporter permease [Synechococcus sp. PCC 7336]
MLEWLLEPLNYEFMRYSLTMGIIVGILCPVTGAFLIVQRLSLLGNVISHSVLPGLAIANFFGIDLVLGAFVSGMASTLAIAWIRAKTRVKADAAMSLTLVSFFAIGVALLSLLDSRLDLEDLLFGNILSVSIGDVWQAAAVMLATVLVAVLFYKELLFFTFDRNGAEAAGLPVHTINVCFVAAVTLTIVVGMQAVGVILVISLLVGPALTAYLLVKELHWTIAIGSLLGATSSASGMYLSYYFDLPSGPAIAMVVFGLFLLALLTRAFSFRQVPAFPGDRP